VGLPVLKTTLAEGLMIRKEISKVTTFFKEMVVIGILMEVVVVFMLVLASTGVTITVQIIVAHMLEVDKTFVILTVKTAAVLIMEIIVAEAGTLVTRQ
jgi:hypothetical protein